MYTVFFFFNDTATTEIYTLSLHDALPIWIETFRARQLRRELFRLREVAGLSMEDIAARLDWSKAKISRIETGRKDRKSTRLNSSHQIISYAVFCLKKKKNN